MLEANLVCGSVLSASSMVAYLFLLWCCSVRHRDAVTLDTKCSLQLGPVDLRTNQLMTVSAANSDYR